MTQTMYAHVNKERKIRNQHGEVMDKQTGNKRKKERNKQTNAYKNSRFKNNRISVSVFLLLLFQHPVLMLVFQ
jgi:hypothetical protein